MSTLVIKEWKVSGQPIDPTGNYVKITGRTAGLISWLLVLTGIYPTTSIQVSRTRVEFSSSSLSGIEHRIIPIANISSIHYGYRKPWEMALFLFSLFGLPINIPGIVVASSTRDSLAVVAGYVLGVVIGAVIALTYYHLNRTFTLGFSEYGGSNKSLRFKKSVIENIDINEEQIRYVCSIIQSFIEAAKRLS